MTDVATRRKALVASAYFTALTTKTFAAVPETTRSCSARPRKCRRGHAG